MAINQQSFLVSNMCGEFMVCGGMRVWSNNLLNRAVCSEESRVMFIEGVPPLPCGIACAVRRLRKKRNWALQLQKLISTSNRRRALSQFLCCRSVASQDGTRNRNRNMYYIICFPSPLCCQNPSLCRMADGQCRQEWAQVFATLMKTILMDMFCHKGQIL